MVLHEHHEHHHSHDDASDKTLTHAMISFGLVGGVGIVIALLTGRIALAVDSIHNLCEVPILGNNRQGGRLEKKNLGRFWTCCFIPLMPALGAIAAMVVAGGFLLLGRYSSTLDAVWIAFGIELLSLSTNGIFAAKLHQDGSHSHHAKAAKSHLIGDTGASGAAVFAYLVMGVTHGNPWLDPVAAFVGFGLIVVFHIGPIKNSLKELKRHRQPNHTDCPNGVNSPPLLA